MTQKVDQPAVAWKWPWELKDELDKPEFRTLVGFATIVLQRLAFGAVILIVVVYLSHFGLSMARELTFQESTNRAIMNTLDSLGRIVRGELGVSPAASSTLNPLPVAEVVPGMIVRSLGLLGVSLLVATLLGLGLGIWAATRRRSGWSLITLLLSIAGISLPSFFTAILLQMGVIRLTRIVGRPFLPVGGFGWDTHIILPALVLAARPLAQIARVTFVSVNEALSQDYVRTARSKGLSSRAVMNRHVLRNTAIPIATTIGTSLRFSLSSLPVVEFFFGWSGVGFYLLKAIARQDDNLTVVLVLFLGVLFIFLNLILDILYHVFDPRLRQIQTQAKKEERERLWQHVLNLAGDVRNLIVMNPIRRWLQRRKTEPEINPYAAILEARGESLRSDDKAIRAERRRTLLRGMLGNLPFVLGAILLGGLLLVVLFGSRLAPYSPYTTRGLTVVEGELTVPPFAPGEAYPWGTDVLGRDIMSLVLTGAWQTLRLTTMVVVARILVGFLLGAIAGWWSGRWIDRFLIGLAETISAFPALLLAMTLILALGIREGFAPFVVALCFVGWGEVMQFVRAEVMTMRPKTFIEGAVAIGLRTPRIILNHVLPNLVPALISIAALEMGAVLMLLGELGFVGIFIGGGAFAELDIDMAPYHYSDVPEWSALLSNVRTFVYGYPWTALYPGIAFFVAILGFNLFGEGVRRLVDDVGVRLTRLLNRYSLALIVVGALVINWIQGATGSTAVYRVQSGAFDGDRAWKDVEALTSPSLEGRGIGTLGMEVTADWIALQFEDLGLQAAGETLTYFQYRPRGYEVLDAVPSLSIADSGPGLVYHRDFVEFAGYYRNRGMAYGNVRALVIGELARRPYSYWRYPVLEDLDFSEEIVLVLSTREAVMLRQVTCAGVLVVTEDPIVLERSYTLSSISPIYETYGGQLFGKDTPMLWINEAAANRILAGAGYSVADLRQMTEDLGLDEVAEIPLDVMAAMDVEGTAYENERVRQVIGHMPGIAGMPGSKLDDRMIIVMAQYDNPPPSPDGRSNPGANDNASGIAVMLEVVRTFQDTGYQPYKTFLFVAYSGEGLEGGTPVTRPEVFKLLEAKQGFSSTFDVEAVIDLRGMGAGDGESLLISTGGSLRLAELFEDVAQRMGVPVTRTGDVLDISVVFDTGSRYDSGEEAPSIRLSWDAWQAQARTSRDTLEAISPEKLEKAGEVLSFALMILGREIDY